MQVISGRPNPGHGAALGNADEDALVVQWSGLPWVPSMHRIRVKGRVPPRRSSHKSTAKVWRKAWLWRDWTSHPSTSQIATHPLVRGTPKWL